MQDTLEQPHRRLGWFLLPVILLVVIIAVLGTIFYFYNPSTPPPPTNQAAATPITPKVADSELPVAEGLNSRLLFLGDVFWGRYVQARAEKSPLGYNYLTSKLSAEDRNQYDAWIANFECPITTKDVAYDLQVDNLKFNCRPEYLPSLAKWFTAASQANNHTANNGLWGLEQTRLNLKKAGIQYFGNYNMSQTNDICEVITVPAKTTIKQNVVAMPIALCGFMYVTDVIPTDAQLAVMQRYAKVMPVIAMPHMGIEYRSTAEAAKTSAYRRMVDNGADMVVGAHPHVIQNSEVYKGKLIAYSMGNFLFDQQTLGQATTLGLGVGLTIEINDTQAAETYRQVAPACKTYKDDCLAQLETSLKQRPEINVSYRFTCYDEKSGLPQLGQAKQAATVDQLNGLGPIW